MSEKRPCPIDGMFRYSCEEEAIFARLPPERADRLATYGCAVMIAVGLASLGSMFTLRLIADSLLMGILATGLALLGAVIVAILYIPWENERQAREGVKTRSGTLYRYYCHVCGYRWDLKDGDPWPSPRTDSPPSPEHARIAAQLLLEEEEAAEAERRVAAMGHQKFHK